MERTKSARIHLKKEAVRAFAKIGSKMWGTYLTVSPPKYSEILDFAGKSLLGSFKREGVNWSEVSDNFVSSRGGSTDPKTAIQAQLTYATFGDFSEIRGIMTAKLPHLVARTGKEIPIPDIINFAVLETGKGIV